MTRVINKRITFYIPDGLSRNIMEINTYKTHRDLDVWKVSMDFVIDLYKITEGFPNAEKFGIVSQLRRAGVSISSNIAEGAARSYKKEFVQFLFISLGSVSEVETN
jgi:hypothetical protein